MKKLIRHNVHETNSSSSHVISIADATKEFVLDTIYPNDDGEVVIYGSEFGWEWERYNDATTKASYAAQQFANDEYKLDILKSVIQEHTQAETVTFVGLEDGYVDHQSMSMMRDFTEEKLKDFVFNKNSWLFLGNDNSTADPMFYETPEYRGGKIVEPVFKYQLKIKGFHKTTKFKDYPIEEELENGIEALLDDYSVTSDLRFVDRHSYMGFGNECYKLSYKCNSIDLENKVIRLENNVWSAAKKIWDENYSGNDWGSELGYKKCSEIERELINSGDPKYVIFVEFDLVEL
jgi:hypothetical protein